MFTERESTDREDVALLERVARGDEQAFAALFDRYSHILLGLLIRIVGSRAEAEDVLQEVFLQVWQRAGSYNVERGHPFTWLVTVARSRAIDRLRASNARERAVTTAAAQDVTPLTADASDEAVRAEEGERVRQALSAIPEEQRRALLLAYFEGLTQSEIAERLRQPLGTIKTRMRSGMMRLRELLGKQVGGVNLGL